MLNPDFSDMLSAFTGESVEYIVVGAYALAVHGVPRATGDLDFWIRPSAENASRVLRALAAFGAPAGDLTIQDLTTPDLVFQIGVEPSRIDILTSIDDVTFDEAVETMVIARIGDLDVPVLGREALIRNKRAVGRPQDLADVAQLESTERDDH